MPISKSRTPSVIQGLVTHVHHTMRLRSPPDEPPPAAATRRVHLEASLAALRHLVEGTPRLAALMASRPALAPLLECVEPSVRCDFGCLTCVDRCSRVRQQKPRTV